MMIVEAQRESKLRNAMQTIVIDDNITYAEALAKDIGDGSMGLLSGKDFSTLDEVEGVLEAEIKKIRGGDEEDASFRVLINRELKLQDRTRQEMLGEKLYQRATWRYPEVPFRLYSFRAQDVEAPCTRLPFAADDLPDPDEGEQLEAKEQACLTYINEEFKKIQHDIGKRKEEGRSGSDKVDATSVNLIRLIYGAVLSRKITEEKQVYDLLDLLISLGNAEHEDRIQSFVESARGLAELLQWRLDSDTDGPKPSESHYRRVVVVDDESTSGESPWATVLNILFGSDGYEFGSKLPSEVERNLSDLRGADLILLDINFSRDSSYSGKSRYGGLDLLGRLQTLAPDLPVIMMSSYDEIGLYEACMEAGAHNYLTKQWNNYAKHGSKVSEGQWFEVWEQTISTPLRHQEFFKDVWKLRGRNLATSALPSLRGALREIRSPDLSTARALVSFLEAFAKSYAKRYSGADSGRKRRTLSEQLEHPYLKHLKGSLDTNTVLRKLRNSIVHYERFINQRLDVWLFLILLRVLILRGLEEASASNRPESSSCSWMRPFTERYAEALGECDISIDKDFFETAQDDRREYYGGLLGRRESLLEKLSDSKEMTPTEFGNHIELFVRLLTALVSPDLAFQQGGAANQRSAVAIVRSLRHKVIKGEKSYKEAFEFISPVDWLLDHPNDFRLLLNASKRDELQDRLRWFLAVRCWIWYFDEFIGRPNEMLFERFRKYASVPSDNYLTTPNENLVSYFNGRGLYSYVASYAMLIASSRVQRRLNSSRRNRAEEVERVQEEREHVDEEIKLLAPEVKELTEQIDEKNQDLAEAEQRSTETGADVNAAQGFQQRIDKLQYEKTDLANQRNEKQQRLRALEMQREELQREEEEMEEVLAVFPEYAEAFLTVQSADRLEKILRLGLADIATRRDDEFDPEPCISRLRNAQDFEDVTSGIRELNALLR